MTDWIPTVDDRQSNGNIWWWYSGRIPTNCTVAIRPESDRFGQLGRKLVEVLFVGVRLRSFLFEVE